MNRMNPIRLKTSSIVGVPLNTYDDFTFIVNEEEFKTSYFIAELLSTKICKIHLIDPTVSSFTINTVKKGNFSIILNLVNFKYNTFTDDEIEFIIKKLNVGNKRRYPKFY